MVAFAWFTGLVHYTRLQITRPLAELFHLTAVCAWLRWPRQKVQQQQLLSSSTNEPSMPKSWGRDPVNKVIVSSQTGPGAIKVSRYSREIWIYVTVQRNSMVREKVKSTIQHIFVLLTQEENRTLLPDAEWLLDLAFLTDETEELNNPEGEESQRQSWACDATSGDMRGPPPTRRGREFEDRFTDLESLEPCVTFMSANSPELSEQMAELFPQSYKNVRIFGSKWMQISYPPCSQEPWNVLPFIDLSGWMISQRNKLYLSISIRY